MSYTNNKLDTITPQQDVIFCWRHSLNISSKIWWKRKLKLCYKLLVIWGGFSVNNATLNRFFSLHFVLPFVLAALALMHLIVLHDTAGSGNPLGVSGNYERISFAPYYIFKDLITIFLFIFVLSLFVFFMPNVLGDSENYVMANPMQTPAAIVPEW